MSFVFIYIPVADTSVSDSDDGGARPRPRRIGNRPPDALVGPDARPCSPRDRSKVIFDIFFAISGASVSGAALFTTVRAATRPARPARYDCTDLFDVCRLNANKTVFASLLRFV